MISFTSATSLSLLSSNKRSSSDNKQKVSAIKFRMRSSTSSYLRSSVFSSLSASVSSPFPLSMRIAIVFVVTTILPMFIQSSSGQRLVSYPCTDMGAIRWMRDPNYCDQYYICHFGQPLAMPACPKGQVWGSKALNCVPEGSRWDDCTRGLTSAQGIDSSPTQPHKYKYNSNTNYNYNKKTTVHTRGQSNFSPRSRSTLPVNPSLNNNDKYYNDWKSGQVFDGKSLSGPNYKLDTKIPKSTFTLTRKPKSRPEQRKQTQDFYHKYERRPSTTWQRHKTTAPDYAATEYRKHLKDTPSLKNIKKSRNQKHVRKHQEYNQVDNNNKINKWYQPNTKNPRVTQNVPSTKSRVTTTTTTTNIATSSTTTKPPTTKSQLYFAGFPRDWRTEPTKDLNSDRSVKSKLKHHVIEWYTTNRPPHFLGKSLGSGVRQRGLGNDVNHVNSVHRNKAVQKRGYFDNIDENGNMKRKNKWRKVLNDKWFLFAKENQRKQAHLSKMQRYVGAGKCSSFSHYR